MSKSRGPQLTGEAVSERRHLFPCPPAGSSALCRLRDREWSTVWAGGSCQLCALRFHRTGRPGGHSAGFPCPSPSGRIFTKVVLEAPLITESALEVIRKYCEDEVRAGRWQISLCPQHRGAGEAPLATACGRSEGHGA